MLNNSQYQSGINLVSINQRLRAPVYGEYITLVPLTTDHALAYFSHYQLNDIQQMTDLPRFANVREVCEWIKEETAVKNSYNFAIELPVTGFAGFVNLTVSEHAAFFGIWLGEKFQGLGLGTQTGRLICHHALQVGLSVIFTAAFLTNRRSILMLKKVGFDTLPIGAYAPHDDRAFFILTHDLAIKQNGNIELMNYYKREDLPHSFYQISSE
jgi:RimJ/RimL family protein N-acetyltransferase